MNGLVERDCESEWGCRKGVGRMFQPPNTEANASEAAHGLTTVAVMALIAS